MKRNVYFNLTIALGIALLLIGGVVIASRVQAQGPGPGLQEVLAPQSAVDTAFTYQGRLIDDSTPVEGTCNFGLSLYGSPTEVDQIGTTQDKPDVSVSNGYFTITDLDFGAGAFDGNARYLEIAVDCGGGPATLEPRVALNAAPYAHSLRPGAKVEGTSTVLQLSTSATSGNALDVSASASSGNAAAVYGSSISPDGAGLSGYNESSGYGVYGRSTSGHGVYGRSGSTSGKPALTGTGVWGDNADHTGVYGTSNTAAGVFGWSTSNAGVGGLSTSSYGVQGTSDSGTGVYGTASTTGTAGIATDSGGYGVYGYSASGHGVHGKADAPDGYGIYSEGNAYVEGELFWDAKTSYVSVAAAAFHPRVDGYDFTNNGHTLNNENSDSDYYLAPVQLPHGAIVTELTFYWSDESSEDGSCNLYRIDLAGGEEPMALAYTSGDAGASTSSEDTTIDYAAVDNSQYAYYLWLVLPENTVRAYGVVIKYTISEPY